MRYFFIILTLIVLSSFKIDAIKTNHQVTSDCIDSLIIPEGFSPNGDGINDIYEIIFACPPSSMSFNVANTWGENILEVKEPNFKWNGRDVDGKPYASGVYNWSLSCVFNGEVYETSGELVIMR